MRIHSPILGILTAVATMCLAGCATPLAMTVALSSEFDSNPEVVPQIMPSDTDSVATTPTSAAAGFDTTATEDSISGQLDGPSLRIAVQDLAVILDLVGRIEKVQPSWRRELLAELAVADGPTAATIVAQWQAKITAAEELKRQPPIEAINKRIAESSARDQDETANPVATVSNSGRPESTGTPTETVKSETNTQIIQRLTPDDQINYMIQSLEHENVDPQIRPLQIQLLQLIQKLRSTNDGDTATTSFLTQLHPAIALCLDSDVPEPEQIRRAIRALETVTSQIRGPANLKITSMNFCNKVEGFGRFEMVDPHSLAAGQAVILYAEIENIQAEQSDSQFVTELETEIRIIGTHDTEVATTIWSHSFQISDSSRSKRSDYFISHQFRLPETLEPGHYRIQLFVLDTLASESAAEVIGFNVK